jgi:hypothetical protein
LHYQRSTNTFAQGINDNGDVSGGYDLSYGPTQGFVFFNASQKFVSFELGTGTYAGGINNSDEIVGSFSSGQGTYGFYGTPQPK